MAQLDCSYECRPCEDCCVCEAPSVDTTRLLRRAAWALTVLTILWNSIEAAVALAAGIVARSVALVGFGLDSVVETASAVAVAWRLTRTESAERIAVRLVALSFFGIGAFVTFNAVATLAGWAEAPEESTVGLVLVVLSLVVMPALAWAKRRLARRMGSVTLHADAAETQVCAYLSIAVLAGLAANALAGWWWMDPIAALAVACVAFYEGQRAWAHGELCAEGARQLCGADCCPACPLA
jgi:divalent metal cation (Fe/Co/Zn/Cd) transporter